MSAAEAQLHQPLLPDHRMPVDGGDAAKPCVIAHKY
jgi:hypothetical protein